MVPPASRPTTPTPATPTPATPTPATPREGRDVLLRHGRVAQVRPVVPDDADALHALNARLSPRTRRLRYFSASEGPGDSYVDRVLRSTRTHDSLVAVVDGQVVALASCFRLEHDPDVAELALLVDDQHQDDGLGALLLEHLAVQARLQGITALVADVLAENGRMIQLLRESGFALRSRTSHGVTELQLDLVERPEQWTAVLSREVASERASLAPVLAPASVAVVGSLREESIGGRVAASLRRSGFPGSVQLVDRSAALRGPVDLVVVAVPAAAVLDVARAAAAAGARGLLVLSSGFAETGPEGAARQAELLGLCRDAGMRLVGPNCLGLVNTDPAVRLDTTFSDAVPRPGELALVSQSGAVGVAALRHAEARGAGLSLFVSIGNRADVSTNDLLAYLEGDSRTGVVALYAESLGQPRRFARIAAAVGRDKPVVVVKAGRTEAGARAGQSHTAAATTPEVAVAALLQRAGVVRVDDLPALFDVVDVLGGGVLPTGRRVAVIGNSGGPGVLAADACAAAGLELARLTPATTRLLSELLPPGAGVEDPVDLLATVEPEAYERAVTAVLADPGVDAVVAIYTALTRGDADRYAEALARARAAVPDVLLVAAFPGVADVPSALRGVVPVFEFPEPAVQALGRVAAYAAWREAPPAAPAPPPFPTARARARAVLLAGGQEVERDRWLSPSEVTEVLQAYDVPVARVVEVADPAGAVAAAQELGLPVALKATGPRLVHKSDVGGVRLDLTTGEDVRQAYVELEQLLGSAMSGAVVQRMHPSDGGLELLLGVSVDPEVGPLVLAAAGGVLTELLDDRVVRLPPESREHAEEQLSALRCAPLFEGFRGRPALDREAVVDVLLSLAALVRDLPEVRELDLNPLLVGPSGAVCLDARLRVGPAREDVDVRALSLRG